MDFKETLYNYEVNPPENIWANIDAALSAESAQLPLRKKPRIYLYVASAAASVIIIVIGFIVFNKRPKELSASPAFANQITNGKKTQDSILLNNKILEEIITTTEDKNLLALNYEYSLKGRKYLTIAGPEGQPVKISPKAATLIESADNEFPPKPVWNKQVDKWQQIMLSNMLSPTSANLLDIVQMPVSGNNN